jgi:hypothetical protein
LRSTRNPFVAGKRGGVRRNAGSNHVMSIFR